jgi:hypothetical protein
MFLVALVVGIVGLVFRVDVQTWNTSVILLTLALVLIAIGVAVNLVLRGVAKRDEARALQTAAEGRRAHGWQPNAPTYNTTIDTVNVLCMRNPETGDVRFLPAGDAAQAGRLMRQYARQGYELEVEAR